MDDGGWDLEAVVRGCRFAGSAATADPFSSFPPSLIKDEPPLWEEGLGLPTCFTQLLGSGSTGLEELDELCKSFFSEPEQQPLLLPQRCSPSPSSSPANPVVSIPPAIALPETKQPQQPRQPQRPVSQMSRSKRRKNQQKKVVCHVPADGLSSDMWAWRKYGQKPIKGSPYPRGYYRCSSSKGCLARKQVERSRTDPSMFIITYTAEHNHPVPTHRNSLAGSTRTKFPSPSSAAASTPSASASAGGEQPPPVSSPFSAGLSPTTPLTASMEDELLQPRRGPSKAEDGGAGEEAEEEEEEGVLMVEDMEVMGEDDFVFMGLDELGGSSGGSSFFDDGGSFDDHLFAPPWLANNSNTAAAAGGD